MHTINEILSDYSDFCIDKITSEFGQVDLSQNDVIYLYQRYKCRIITPLCRDVLKPKGFQIPDEYQCAFDEIVHDITSGKSLKKYQSRRLKNINYDDDMLSHWNIHHFHLGQEIENDGFVKRTKELLFIYFSDSKAFVVGFFEHGAWCNLDIIEVIHNNWPEELHQYSSKSESFDEKDIKMLRSKNVNSAVTVKDGTHYFSPGGGVTTNGAPISALMNTIAVKHMFKKAYDNISENIDLILHSDPKSRKTRVATIGLEIRGAEKKLIYKIKETGYEFTI